MKILLLALLLPYIFFKPDPVDEAQHIRPSNHSIFKEKPNEGKSINIEHTDKKIYNWIASDDKSLSDM